MKKPYLLLLLAPVLIFGGCAGRQATQKAGPTGQEAVSQTRQGQIWPATTTKNEPAAASAADEITAHDPFAPVLKGDDIYCFGQKVGTHKDGRVYMKLNDKIVSFIPPKLHGTEVDDFNANEMTCESGNWEPDENGNVEYGYTNFSYQGLEVSTKIYGPYGVYKTVETTADNNRITYDCDSSLAITYDDETRGYTKSEPFYYCTTDHKGYLTQYEFSGAEGHPVLTTGGDYGKGWTKVYIRRADGLNYFFTASLTQNDQDYWSSDYPQEKFDLLSQKSRLDELLKSPPNTISLALWQMLVDSFRVETRDEFGLK